MNPSHLALSAAGTPNKEMQIKDAKDMYQVVLRNAQRSNSAVPPYEFIELIGKGASGRVYKCRSKRTGDLVAVKIVNIDAEDYSSDPLDKDDTLDSFRKEVAILQQLKDSKARNVNLIHEAFDLHNQLWIISDYCTGGSVRTLMRANPPPNKGLEEAYIIPIARELAKAIKSVHDIGVIHRDIKCTNVYISEVGEIQLGDFGIVGVIDDGDGSSKRKTIIGTPHFMPREMLHATDGNLTEEGYGMEVDIWAYGCTIFEMATGSPPNANIFPQNLPTALEKAPRLDEDQYSTELCAFVAFCLESDPAKRPSINAILSHFFIAETETRHPTKSLIQLIDRYTVWEVRGGQRQSLFMRGGAAAPDVTDDATAAEDDEYDWNFSTSDHFTQAFSKRMSHMIAVQDFANPTFGGSMSDLASFASQDLTPLEQFEQFHKEQSANRGERSLDRLWNPDSSPYELHTPVDHSLVPSDLPLRNFGTAQPRESLIDLDTIGSVGSYTNTRFNFDFEDLPTMKARDIRDTYGGEDHEQGDGEYSYNDLSTDDKRATMDWKFPGSTATDESDVQTMKRSTMAWTFPSDDLQAEKRATMEWTFPSSAMLATQPVHDRAFSSATTEDDGPGDFRPRLKHSATEPLGYFRGYDAYSDTSGPPTAQLIRDSMQSTIDLDLSNADSPEYPRPRTSSSAAASETSINPFALDVGPAPADTEVQRFSYHKPWQSEGGQVSRPTSRNILFHSRANSLTSTDSEAGTYLRRPELSAQPSLLSDCWTDVESVSGVDEEDGERHPTIRAPRSGAGSGSGSGSSRSAKNIYGGHVRTATEDIFPMAQGIHPEALRDGAPAALLQSELDRLLEQLDVALENTSRAMAMFIDSEEEEMVAEESMTTDEDEAH